MTPPNVLLEDDFRRGLDLIGTWALLSRPPSAFALNTLDPETGMVFDIWMTNNSIYPYYERLNLTGTSVNESR